MSKQKVTLIINKRKDFKKAKSKKGTKFKKLQKTKGLKNEKESPKIR